MLELPFPPATVRPSQRRNTINALRVLLPIIALTAVGLVPVITQAALPLGVAAGDVNHNSAVLWAYSDTPGDLTFELSQEPDFGTLVQTQVVTVEAALPVKVAFGDLFAGIRHYYRVTDAEGAIAEGTFRTLVPVRGNSGTLTFGALGDLNGSLAPFPVLRDLADRKFDFFVALGDTIRADRPSPAVPAAAESLDEFRRKHAEVYEGDGNALRHLRQSTAWYVTADDGEVVDAYAGAAPVFTDPRFDGANPNALVNDAPLYEDALLAFQEFNPVFTWRYSNASFEGPETAGELRLFRYREFGNLAATLVLDGRSFRDENLPQPPLGDTTQEALFRQAADDPERSLLGQGQLRELKRRLRVAQNAGITWKFIFLPQPIQNLGVYGAADRYEGFAAERDDLLHFLDRNFITNVVFVSSGQGATLVNNLTYRAQPDGPQLASSAFEIVISPVASDTLLGPELVREAVERGLLTANDEVGYQVLPRWQQNAFVQQLLDDMLANGISNGSEDGYDPLGLEGSGLQVTSVTGDEAWVSAHNFGWTEFSIRPDNRRLLVTHHALTPYSEADVLADRDAVAALEPAVIGQFAVDPVDVATSDSTKLYLFDDRFEVSASYVDNRGIRHVATPQSLGRRAGWFSFANPVKKNPELVVKILDGRGLTGSHWIFAAGLSRLDYQLVVRDRQLGEERVFDNPRGVIQSFVDLRPFEQKAGSSSLLAPFGTEQPLDDLFAESADLVSRIAPMSSAETSRATDECVSDGQQRICLLGRVQVTIEFEAGISTPPPPSPRSQVFSDIGGYYWLRQQDNPEVAVKALASGHGYYWLFVGGLTNRPFTVTFEDTLLGNSVTHSNPGGTIDSVFLPRLLPTR